MLTSGARLNTRTIEQNSNLKDFGGLHKKLARSFIRVGVMYVLGIPLALLISIVLARALGPQAFGQYSFVMALLTILALPVVAGLPQLLTREVAAYTQARKWSLYRGINKAANVWVFLVSLMIILFYVFINNVVGWLPTEGKWTLLGTAVLLVPFRGLSAVRNGIIRGLGFPALGEMPTQIIQPAILLVVLAVLSSAGKITVLDALWVQIIVTAITFVIATLLFVMVQPVAASNFKPEYRPRGWLMALVPFTMIGMVGTLNSQIGIVLLGLLGEDESVAAFRVAERGAQFVAISLALVNIVISPYIVKEYREGNKYRLQRLARQSARGAFLLALPIGFILVAFGNSIIGLAFGAEYAEIAYVPMVVLIFGQLFNVAMGSVGLILSMSGYEKVSLKGQLVGLATTLLFAIMLIPWFQQLGAAIAASAGLVTWNVLMAISVSKQVKIRAGII